MRGERLPFRPMAGRPSLNSRTLEALGAARLAELEATGATADAGLLLRAVQDVLPRLHGAYALALIWAKAPGALVVARRQAQIGRAHV